MSRPLFAVITCCTFWLTFMMTSFVYGSHGGHADLGERAAIGRALVMQYPSTGWKQDYRQKRHECFDELSEELQLVPMWCEDNELGNLLYPYQFTRKESRNVPLIADVALW